MRFDQADDDLFGRLPQIDSMQVRGGPEYGDGNHAHKSKQKPLVEALKTKPIGEVPYLPPHMVHKKPRVEA